MDRNIINDIIESLEIDGGNYIEDYNIDLFNDGVPTSADTIYRGIRKRKDRKGENHWGADIIITVDDKGNDDSLIIPLLLKCDCVIVASLRLFAKYKHILGGYNRGFVTDKYPEYIFNIYPGNELDTD